MLAIVLKEFKSRMRGWRTPVVLTLYVGVLALVAYLQAQSISERAQFAFGNNNPAAQGEEIFSTLAGFQLALLIFLTPAFSAGSIAGERERQTFDLLLCTGLSARAIILGKYVAALAFVLLLLWASLPVFSLVLLFGGVTVMNVVSVMLLCFATSVAISALTVMLSAIFHPVQIVTALAYGVVFVQTVGIVIVPGVTGALVGNGSQPSIGMMISPVTALITLLSAQNTPYVSVGILPLPTYLVRNLPLVSQVHLMLWQVHVLFDVLIAFVALGIAAAVIRPIRRIPRFRR